jgi:hypothetical protein
MKRFLFITVLAFGVVAQGWGQNTGQQVTTDILAKEVESNEVRLQNISFALGIGSSFAMKSVYQMPIVSPLDNSVKIEKGDGYRINAAFGIVYSPYTYKITDHKHPDGYLAVRGPSFVAFFNPLNLTSGSSLENDFNLSDFGLGIGWKFVKGIGVYLVGELYSVKQPRQWFIDEFKKGDSSYMINGQIQSAFSPTDETIFRNKLIPHVGIKVCYSFDIIKSFSSTFAQQN